MNIDQGQCAESPMYRGRNECQDSRRFIMPGSSIIKTEPKVVSTYEAHEKLVTIEFFNNHESHVHRFTIEELEKIVMDAKTAKIVYKREAQKTLKNELRRIEKEL